MRVDNWSRPWWNIHAVGRCNGGVNDLGPSFHIQVVMGANAWTLSPIGCALINWWAAETTRFLHPALSGTRPRRSRQSRDHCSRLSISSMHTDLELLMRNREENSFALECIPWFYETNELPLGNGFTFKKKGHTYRGWVCVSFSSRSLMIDRSYLEFWKFISYLVDVSFSLWEAIGDLHLPFVLTYNSMVRGYLFTVKYEKVILSFLNLILSRPKQTQR